jgi:predicted amidohydrolase
MVQVALLQLNSGPDITENLKVTADLVREAAGRGAKFILTPENTCHMISPQSEKLKTSPNESNHPALPLFSNLAWELGVWILVGSIAVKVAEDKIANRSYFFNDSGKQVGQYDKIHLFDVDLPTGESHRESNVVMPGKNAVAVQTPFGKIGMTICYDLRFSNLYRELAKAGADILVIPAAFTVPTGQAHWEALLRARAIETGSYVLAPAQCGTHHGGRKTYGHSLIVSPWGEVLADGGDDVGIVTAELDIAEVKKARNAIPSLQHDREFILLD